MQSKITITPHHNKVLIKISKKAWEALFFQQIIRDDGTKTRLFTDMEAGEEFDKRYAQNVSVGVVIAVGDNVQHIKPSDHVILDYLVSNQPQVRVGKIKGDLIVSVPAFTTYHDRNAPRDANFRRAFVRGDYNVVSPIIGLVRNSKLVSFDPYIILEYKNPYSKVRMISGLEFNTKEGVMAERKVLSAFQGAGCKEGDIVFVARDTVFERNIGGRLIQGITKEDMLAVK